MQTKNFFPHPKSVLMIFTILMLSFCLFACSPGAESASGSGYADAPISEPGAVDAVVEEVAVEAEASESSAASGSSQGISAGTLTAGDVDDNLNFAFFQDYRANMLESGIGRNLSFASISDRVTLHFLDEDMQGPSNLWLSITPEGANKPIIETYTGTNGVFQFFPRLDGGRNATRFTVQVWQSDQDTLLTTAEIDLENLNSQRRLDIVIPDTSVQHPEALDLMLVIDTTGSMSDELNYLTTEFQSIINTIQSRHPGISIRFGLILYRDEGDQYVVRSFDFVSDLDEMQSRLSKQSAGGGGDYPEALDQALNAAINAHWRDGNTARMLFLVADAPPHEDNTGYAFEYAYIARRKGIRIYPLAASGVADAAEFLMRHAALITQGRYLFLTDDSGVGNAHAEPKIPCYVVTRLDQLMIRVIDSELSGFRIEPSNEQIIRQTGTYDGGVCISQ